VKASEQAPRQHEPTNHHRLLFAPIVWVLAALKLGLHLVTAGSYGWHGDELYYKACGEHLAWGYVDHPPLSIVAMAAWSAIGGDGMTWARIPAALAGALTLLGTSLIARELGGRGWAQGLAALVMLAAGGNFVMHGYASMNAFDTAFWTLAMWLSLRVAAKPSRKTWLLLGLVMGLGLLNKWSVAWLGVGLIIGWLASRERRLLASRDPWIALAVTSAIVAPNILWQFQHGWPTLEFVQGATANQLLPVGPLGLGLFVQQVIMMNPVATPVWLAGLFVLLRDSKRPGARALGISFLVVVAILLIHGASKPYYLTLAQPPLVAAGAVWLTAKSERIRGGRVGLVSFTALLCIAGLLALPLALRLLPPAKLVAYQSAVAPKKGNEARGKLDEHFSIHFGWPGLVDEVEKVYRALPPEERDRTIIFTPTYAGASAIEFFGRGRGLPPAVSGHNSYWLWGPPEREPIVVIIVGGYGLEPAVFEKGWSKIEEEGRSHCEWCSPNRSDRPIWVARGLKHPFREIWPHLRHYD
jgi:Dolichyl-phosphate-mannose-protein mannosyltransferase